VSPITDDNWKRTPDDNNVLAVPESRFEKNADVNLDVSEKVTASIVPKPLQTTLLGGKVSVKDGVTISNDNALPEDMLAAVDSRLTTLGVNAQGSYPVSVSLDANSFSKENQKSGAYRLYVTDGKATVVGYDQQGAFYGLQSLISLIPMDEEQLIPTLRVLDAPRLDYRGINIDVARNFHSKEVLLRSLDQMAAYKLNKFHLHLTDDEGWRIEIPGLPELTEVGGQRCHDLDEQTCLLPQLGSGPDSNNFGSGYLTRADYIEILKYAKARGIEVIPEIDMPAHSRAAVVSMEARYNRLVAEGDLEGANEYRLMDPTDTSNVTTVQFYDKRSFINPCMDSSLKFADKIISEVKQMHDEAGNELTTWHFGGDEAKNIYLGGGYQDTKTEESVEWKGNIDKSMEDKPFAKSQACQTALSNGMVEDYEHLPSHFAEQVSKLVKAHNISNFQAWQDGLKDSTDASSFATETTTVNFWDTLFWGGGASAYEWAEKGYDVIVSNPDYLYLDFPYEVDPNERGYYWATRATDTRKLFAFAPENLPQNAETSVDRDGNGFNSKGEVHESKASFTGMSAHLWSESVRTDEDFEYHIYPRVLSNAERAWSKGDWELDYKAGKEYSQETSFVDKDVLLADWQRFANILGQRELAKMDAAGVQYRVPLPGAKVIDGVLNMNISMPGLELQYSLDGEKWMTYNSADKPSVNGNIWIRALSGDGERVSRVTALKA
ncbi:MAG: family 20 glycosylhydrolase, partial [Psychromonas sp.]